MVWASLAFSFVAKGLRDIAVLLSAGGSGVILLKNNMGVPFWNAWIELTIVGAIGVIVLFYGKQLGIIVFPIAKLIGIVPIFLLKQLVIVLIFCAEKILGYQRLIEWWERICQPSTRLIEKLFRKIAKFIDKRKAGMHKGLMKRIPAVTLASNVLPIPVFGEITLIASRTFVGLKAVKFYVAILWLLVNCPIRSFIWCVIVYYILK